MHLFFYTVWKLHIGEIPEKPDPKNYLYPSPLVSDLKQYEQAIAAIKQNALTVGNPEIFLRDEWGYGKFIHMPDGSNHLIESDHFYFWPGGYETKEKELWTSEREPASCFTTVAILTLPEEKKNTMENLTEKQRKETKDDTRLNILIGHFEQVQKEWPKASRIFQDREAALRAMETYAASGSVAAPKEDERDALIKAQSDYIDFLSAAIAQPVSFLHTHNWNYSEEDIEKGKKLREVIEKARKLLSK